MIYDYFSIAPSTELKLRKKRIEGAGVSKRSLEILAEDRVKRYVELMPTEIVVEDLVNDCQCM